MEQKGSPTFGDDAESPQANATTTPSHNKYYVAAIAANVFLSFVIPIIVGIATAASVAVPVEYEMAVNLSPVETVLLFATISVSAIIFNLFSRSLSYIIGLSSLQKAFQLESADISFSERHLYLLVLALSNAIALGMSTSSTEESASIWTLLVMSIQQIAANMLLGVYLASGGANESIAVARNPFAFYGETLYSALFNITVAIVFLKQYLHNSILLRGHAVDLGLQLATLATLSYTVGKWVMRTKANVQAKMQGSAGNYAEEHIITRVIGRSALCVYSTIEVCLCAANGWNQSQDSLLIARVIFMAMLLNWLATESDRSKPLDHRPPMPAQKRDEDIFMRTHEAAIKRQQFSRYISHEIRTHLGITHSSLDLCGKAFSKLVANTAAIFENCDNMSRSELDIMSERMQYQLLTATELISDAFAANRSAVLVLNDIIDVENLKENLVKLVAETVPVEGFIEGKVRVMKALARTSNHELRVLDMLGASVGDRTSYVRSSKTMASKHEFYMRIDRVRIFEQVLLHMVTNAMKIPMMNPPESDSNHSSLNPDPSQNVILMIISQSDDISSLQALEKKRKLAAGLDDSLVLGAKLIIEVLRSGDCALTAQGVEDINRALTYFDPVELNAQIGSDRAFGPDLLISREIATMHFGRLEFSYKPPQTNSFAAGFPTKNLIASDAETDIPPTFYLELPLYYIQGHEVLKRGSQDRSMRSISTLNTHTINNSILPADSPYRKSTSLVVPFDESLVTGPTSRHSSTQRSTNYPLIGSSFLIRSKEFSVHPLDQLRPPAAETILQAAPTNAPNDANTVLLPFDASLRSPSLVRPSSRSSSVTGDHTVSTAVTGGADYTNEVTAPVASKPGSADTLKRKDIKAGGNLKLHETNPDLLQARLAFYGSRPVDKEFRILIVDDSAVHRKVLKKILLAESDMFAKVKWEEANDGTVAVDKVKSLGIDNIDAILMDFIMGEMHGPAATKIIRNELGYQGIIVGVTGNVQRDDVEVFVGSGADLVLSKPLNAADLVVALTSVGMTTP